MAEKSATSDQQGTKADEQPKGQAGDGAPGVAEEEEVAEGESTDDEDEESEGGEEAEGDEEEVDELSALSEDEMKGLPPEMRKAVTKKFQTLAAERKALRPYRNLIAALESSPKETVTHLAQQFGIEIAKPKTSTEDAAEDISSKILKAVKTRLGDGYDDLAGPLAAAIQDAAMIVAEERVKATEETLDEVRADAALTEANRAISIVAKRFPDFKKHEAAITALSQRMPPGEGMDQVEYLENLYFLATREGAQGDVAKRTIKKIAKSSGNAESRSSTVPSKAVALAPGKLPTFQEAAAAAKRGEVFE